jgi:predicted DCC family thiol-disulfide oxidoreductase YuxK
MIGGVIFHMSIFVLMDVGSFSIALMAAYLGLLTASDFALFKQVFHAGKERRVLVLYDGRCGLCMRSIATLLTFDWLDRLHPVDFHSPERQKVAPDLSFEKLNKAMHIRLPNGKTYTGFKAMRRLGWVLPALRPLVPFLFLPGVSQVGEWAYKRIAQRRKRCTHEHCNA